MKCPTCQAQLVTQPGTRNLYCPPCATAATGKHGQPTASGFASKDCEGLVGVGTPTEFLCPCCPDVNLQVAQLHGTQVCFCGQCRGFAIDQGSLGDLVNILRSSYDGADDKPTPLNPSDLDKSCRCPACYEKMETFAYCGPGAVVLDSCSLCCLTWFNRGELMKIVRAPGKRDYDLPTSIMDEPLNIRSGNDLGAAFFLMSGF